MSFPPRVHRLLWSSTIEHWLTWLRTLYYIKPLIKQTFRSKLRAVGETALLFRTGSFSTAVTIRKEGSQKETPEHGQRPPFDPGAGSGAAWVLWPGLAHLGVEAMHRDSWLSPTHTGICDFQKSYNRKALSSQFHKLAFNIFHRDVLGSSDFHINPQKFTSRIFIN